MQICTNMNREDFLKKMCPAAGAGILAAMVMLESCSKDEAVAPTPTANTPYDQLLAKTLPSGYFTEGKTLYLNLQKEPYKSLNTIGNYLNDETNGVLLVRKNENTIVVFDNCCPHQGTRNRWTYSNNRFSCGNHGYTFGTEAGQTANCNSNAMFGNLKSFSAALEKDLVTIQLV